MTDAPVVIFSIGCIIGGCVVAGVVAMVQLWGMFVLAGRGDE